MDTSVFSKINDSFLQLCSISFITCIIRRILPVPTRLYIHFPLYRKQSCHTDKIFQ